MPETGRGDGGSSTAREARKGAIPPTGEDYGRRHPAYVIYRAGAAIASALPDFLLFPLAAVGGTLASRFWKSKREVVRRNLSRAVGPEALDAAVASAFRSYSRYWVETLRIPKPGSAEIKRRTTVEGLERVAEYIRAGRGVIFVTAHVGNWDIAAAWLASQDWRVVAIAEEVKPPALYDLFVSLRKAVGVEIHPLGKGSSARAILSALRQGAVVGLVSDRDISGTGIEVELLGEKTMIPAGPAVLAMHTGAVLVVGALFHEPHGRYRGVVLEPIEVEKSRPDDDRVRELTQRLARDLETLILRDPGQWHMFMPNWPTDPGYAAG